MTIIHYQKQEAKHLKAFKHINKWEQSETKLHETFDHARLKTYLQKTNLASYLSKYIKILPPVHILESLNFGQP